MIKNKYMKIELKSCPVQNSSHVTFIVIAYHIFLDVTSVCLIEGFQNQTFMLMADRILKEVGRDLAAERIKVFCFTYIS